MNQDMTSAKKLEMMTTKPVEKLICSMAAPTIVSMLITAIYNMADTFFVSKISTSASGAVGVALSFMAVIQAIGFTFGSGSGTYISRLLGQKNKPQAARVASTGFFTAFGLGIILTISGLLFLDPLVRALGATVTIAPYAKDYIRYILIGTPFMITSFVLNQILRYQGSAFYAMIGIGLGGLLNIILDPIFIFTLHMGIGGAALATIISQFISFLLLLHNSSLSGNIKVQFRNFTPCWAMFGKILSGGLPSFYRQATASSAMIALNFAAGVHGDAVVAAMSITARIFQFALSAVTGFFQGFQPVCGFNYGAGHHDRVLKAFRFSVKTAMFVLIVVAAVGFLFAPRIITLFRKEDLDVVTTGAFALRLQCLTLPLSAWILGASFLLQTIGKNTGASLISLSRQGLFFIPAILLLPRHYGLLGIQMSQPTANLLSSLVALFIAASVLKELKVGHQRKICLIPEPASSDTDR